MFDKTFFKFVIGFACILCASFAVLFYIGYYHGDPQAGVGNASMSR